MARSLLPLGNVAYRYRPLILSLGGMTFGDCSC